MANRTFREFDVATVTPLERPTGLAGKQVFTEEEAAEFAKQAVQNNNADRRDLPPDADVARAYNDFWYDRGNKGDTDEANVVGCGSAGWANSSVDAGGR